MAATADQWARARAAWEAGASNPEAARVAGVSRESVRKRAIAEGWVKQAGAAAAAAEEARARTEAAREEASRKWAVRRSEEADAAGITAAVARQGIVTALSANNPQMVRAAAIAYGILIDKAQLLIGDATQRIDGVSPKERAVGILNELAERRAMHEARATGTDGP